MPFSRTALFRLSAKRQIKKDRKGPFLCTIVLGYLNSEKNAATPAEAAAE